MNTALSPPLTDEQIADFADAVLAGLNSHDPFKRAAALRIFSMGTDVLCEIMDETPSPPVKPIIQYASKQERRNAWFKQRAARDPIFKLNRNVRHAVNQSLTGAKQGRKWQALVGYTLTELRAHLEAQFTDGMGWHNIGEWHVDHIRPLSSFNITSAECEDFKQAWALSNLQPLWGPDNLKKGARWTP